MPQEPKQAPDAAARRVIAPRPRIWRMLLSGNRLRIGEACEQISAAGLTDEYAMLLLKIRQGIILRDWRQFGLRALFVTQYSERERRSALTALGVLWGVIGRDLGIAMDSRATYFERENAYKALTRRRNQRALLPLTQALLEGRMVEPWLCINTLAALGDQRVVDSLLTYLRLDSSTADQHHQLHGEMHALIEAGSEVGKALRHLQADSALGRVTGALASPLPYQRAAAARVIGGWGDEKYAPHLIAMLGDSESLVREMAATALGDLKPVDALEPLHNLGDDPSEAVRTAVERAIQRILIEQTQRKQKAAQRAYYGLPRRADQQPAANQSKAVTR